MKRRSVTVARAFCKGVYAMSMRFIEHSSEFNTKQDLKQLGPTTKDSTCGYLITMLPTNEQSAGNGDLPGSAGSNKKIPAEIRPRDCNFRVFLGYHKEKSWMYQLAKAAGKYYTPISKKDEKETRAEDGTSHKRYDLDFSAALFTRLEERERIAIRFEDLIPHLKSTKDVKRIDPDTREENTQAGHLWFALYIREKIKQAISIRRLEAGLGEDGLLQLGSGVEVAEERRLESQDQVPVGLAREAQNLICDEEHNLSDEATSRELETFGGREDGQVEQLGGSASPPTCTFEDTKWSLENFLTAPPPRVQPADIPNLLPLVEDTDEGPKSSDSPMTQDAATSKRFPEAQEGLMEGGRKDEDMGERILGYQSEGLIYTAIDCDPSTPHHIIAGLGAVPRFSEPPCLVSRAHMAYW